MKQKRMAKRFLALGLVGVLVLATACGNSGTDDAKQNDTTSASANGHFVEEELVLPLAEETSIGTTVIAKNPEGRVELLIQTYDLAAVIDTSLGETGEAAQEEAAATTNAEAETTESAETETADAATAENSAEASQPDAGWKLYSFDESTNDWSIVDAPWMDSISKDIAYVSGMGFDGEGNRYLLYRPNSETTDTLIYTPSKPKLVKIDSNNEVTEVNMDWQVFNQDNGEVTPATFEAMPEMPASLRASLMMGAGSGAVVGGSVTVTADEDEATDESAATSEEPAASETASNETASASESPSASASSEATASPEATAASSDSAPVLVSGSESSGSGQGTDQDEENAYYEASSAAQNTYPNAGGLQVADNGDFFINEYQGVLHYSSDGSYVGDYQIYTNNANLVGNHLYAEMDDQGAASYVDISSGEGVNVAMPALPAGMSIYETSFTEYEDTVYAIGAKGLYSWKQGETEWTTLGSDELLMLSNPNASLQAVYALNGSDFLAIQNFYTGTDNGIKMIRIQHTDEPLPEYTSDIEVYSLGGAWAIETALYNYRVANPTVRIRVTTGYESSSGSDVAPDPQEIIKALNTRILAGEGPDIMVLDNLPIDSFVEKGVLADISDYVNPKIEAGTFTPGLARAYEKDGKIYALPASMSVPMIAGDAEALGQIKNVNDLANYADSGKPVVAGANAAAVLSFVGAEYPELFAQDGSIDEAKMVSFLESSKKIMESDGSPAIPDYYMNSEGNGVGAYIIGGFGFDQSGTISYAYNEAQFAPQAVRDMSTYEFMKAAAKKNSNGAVALMPANGKNIFIPQTVMGINAATDQMDVCKAILDVIVQGSGNSMMSGGGIPLVQSALYPTEPKTERERLEQQAMSTYVYSDESGRMLEFTGTANKADVDAFLKMIEPLDTPVVMDSTVLDAIWTRGYSYLQGDISAEEAAANMNTDLKTYLNEKAK